MKPIFFSILFIIASAEQAYAACQWGYINALNIDIIQARGYLNEYSTCRGDCKALEDNLNRSIRKMSNASNCGAHIFTRGNKDMINFISGRFRLIQKQKQGSTWTAVATKKTNITTVDRPSGSPIQLDKPAFIQPKRLSVSTPVQNVISEAPASQPMVKTVSAAQTNRMVRDEAMPQSNQPPEPVAYTTPFTEGGQQQTTMAVSQEAYRALWEEEAKPQTPPPSLQRAVAKKPRVNHAARQQQLVRQRLIQQRKQAIIHQKKMHLLKVKQHTMQNHLRQQRLIRQQLLKKRELARALNRKRILQRKAVLAQRRARQ